MRAKNSVTRVARFTAKELTKKKKKYIFKKLQGGDNKKPVKL